jgi:predicted DNA-binding WGR domain protein
MGAAKQSWKGQFVMRQEWFNPGNGRRYLVEVYQDLLGDWVLIRRWAGSGRSGNQKMAVLSNYQEAMKQVNGIAGKRRIRGYQPVA